MIRDDFPDSNAVGLDISYRKHIVALMRERRPVISEVFRTIEGVDAVALHVPVLRGAEFKGSVEILVDFKNLAKRYLDVIKVGETGYAWMISRERNHSLHASAGLHLANLYWRSTRTTLHWCARERHAPRPRGYRGIHLSKNRRPACDPDQEIRGVFAGSFREYALVNLRGLERSRMFLPI